MIERIPVSMFRENMKEIPFHKCPSEFNIRTFRKGEEEKWADIEWSVSEFQTKEKALIYFEKEFNPYWEQLEKKLIFVVDQFNQPIGTITAWYGNFHGETLGRIHWLGIKPKFQGEKLAKPLLSRALDRIARSYPKAYLTTQTTSYKAINLYLNFGFKPYIGNERCIKAWTILEKVLKRRIL